MSYIVHIVPHRDFTRDLKKQPEKIKSKTKDKLHTFASNPFDILLNNHALSGKYKGCRSINITGDIRAIYKQINENTAVFIALGSHSELYR